MKSIKDLTVSETSIVGLDVLDATATVLRADIGGVVRGVSREHLRGEGRINTLDIQYVGFTVGLCVVPDNATRNWYPERDYDKNWICTYFYHGTSREYSSANNSLIKTFNPTGKCGIMNDSVVVDFPTYEVYDPCAWLCFSSYKPFTASCIEVRDTIELPPNVIIYNTIGLLTVNGVSVPALHHARTGEDKQVVSGDANIVLIQPGQFVNIPT
jgi:hypothetical protein